LNKKQALREENYRKLLSETELEEKAKLAEKANIKAQEEKVQESKFGCMLCKVEVLEFVENDHCGHTYCIDCLALLEIEFPRIQCPIEFC